MKTLVAAFAAIAILPCPLFGKSLKEFFPMTAVYELGNHFVQRRTSMKADECVLQFETVTTDNGKVSETRTAHVNLADYQTFAATFAPGDATRRTAIFTLHPLYQYDKELAKPVLKGLNEVEKFRRQLSSELGSEGSSRERQIKKDHIVAERAQKGAFGRFARDNWLEIVSPQHYRFMSGSGFWIFVRIEAVVPLAFAFDDYKGDHCAAE